MYRVKTNWSKCFAQKQRTREVWAMSAYIIELTAEAFQSELKGRDKKQY